MKKLTSPEEKARASEILFSRIDKGVLNILIKQRDLTVWITSKLYVEKTIKWVSLYYISSLVCLTLDQVYIL